MSPSRGKRRSALLTVLALAAGLVVLASPQAQTTQNGPNNYFGPAAGAPCQPGDLGWDCVHHSGNVLPEDGLVQIAPTVGKNIFRCDGTICYAIQKGGIAGVPDPNQKPENTGSCGTPEQPNETNEQKSTQTCAVDQQGGNNTITAHFRATASNDDIPTLATVEQLAEQRFITTQDGVKNVLRIIGSINQNAQSNLDASTQVTHDQDTFQLADNKMFATSENVVDYSLERLATAVATGGAPKQLYDDGQGALGLGRIDLVAKSAGKNNIKVRGNQEATQTATSLNLGTVRQLIENSGGGWEANLTVDTGTPNPDADGDGSPDPDVDAGNPATGECGFRKAFTQRASGPLGVDVSKEQDILNQIRFPKLGPSSPKFVQLNTCSEHTADRGGDISVSHFVRGHADGAIVGRAFGSLAAGNCEDPNNSNCETREENYGPARDVVFSFDCRVEVGNVPNEDACPGGASNPVSSASLDVRNENESFDGDGRTQVAQGKPFELLAKIRNNGDAASRSTNNTVTAPVPANTTFVECLQACVLSEDGTAMTFSVDQSDGGLDGGEEGSGTARLQVNANAAPNTTIEIPGTARNDQEGELTAPNTALVDVVAAPPREIRIDVLESTINVSKPKNGVANVVIYDTTVIPSTVCFGDLDEPNDPPDCQNGSNGTFLGEGDFDTTSPGNEVKMKFSIRTAHFEPAEQGQRACLAGQAEDGPVHGCETGIRYN